MSGILENIDRAVYEFQVAHPGKYPTRLLLTQRGRRCLHKALNWCFWQCAPDPKVVEVETYLGLDIEVISPDQVFVE